MNALALLAFLSLAASPEPSATATATGVDAISLPGGPPVGMDYVAFDGSTGRLWVPGGNTGRIYVVDARSGRIHAIEGVPTAKRGERTVGASSAAIGGGFAYVGNRADSSVCAFDAVTLSRAGCVTLPSPPDGLAYVATTQEVWATMPRDDALAVLTTREPGKPGMAGSLKIEGAPEGYAVDPGRGLFYTNLEDKDRTLAIDVRTRKVLATWNPGCGEKGPRGLAVDGVGHVLVACTDGLRVLDASSGAVLARLATGAGVDNIDYLPARRRVYVASGADARLTIAEVAADGSLSAVATTATAEGCRTVVVDDTGSAYLPDSRAGRILVVRTAPK